MSQLDEVTVEVLDRDGNYRESFVASVYRTEYGVEVKFSDAAPSISDGESYRFVPCIESFL